MLGTRRYRDCAIDLWCGPASGFVADVEATETSIGLTSADETKARHLCIRLEVFDSDHLHSQLAILKSRLDSGLDWPQRVTYGFAELGDYKSFQEIFFRVFPEE